MTAFGLVHGSGHGAWCWEPLQPELARYGHSCVAMDLPVDDGSATFEDYAAVVADALAGVEDVVLVGHSLGSMVIPLVPAARPVELLVFLCGVVPNFGGQPWEGVPEEDDEDDDDVVRSADGSWTMRSYEAAKAAFYDDCSDDVARWAYERLRPQNSSSLWDRPYPLTQWPAVPRAAIACLDDRCVPIVNARFVAEHWLEVPLVELPGGHSPFLADPARLARVLDDVVRAAPGQGPRLS